MIKTIFVCIHKKSQNLATKARESSRGPSIVNWSILEIWTNLRSKVSGALTCFGGQIFRLLVYIIPFLGFCFDHVTPILAQKEDHSILFKLKGILILNDWNQVRFDPIDEVNGVNVKGASLLADNPSFLANLQKQFVGKPLTGATVGVIKQSIADFYESKNYPLVIVNIPKQEFANGVLQIVVTETVLGEIRCKGNKYVLSDQLKGYIRTKTGKTISTKELLKDLAFMNHNPFRRTDAIFTPGKESGVADLELITVDRWPYRVYVGADNTGTVSTMRNRLFFGVNLGKTIIQDSEVSYQYTTAPNGNRFFSHTGMVRVPLPGIRHILQAFGGYASVETEKTSIVEPKKSFSGKREEFSSWKSNGISWEVGLRYRIPIFDGLGMLQEVVLGYDFKETGSHAKEVRAWYQRKKGPSDLPLVEDVGPSHFRGQADTSQFMAGYNLGVRNRLRKITLNMELFASPGNMTSEDDGKSYKSLSEGANPHYLYFKIVHSLLQEIASGWRFSYNVSGQVATTCLLPSEQMTMTGYNAVRGFEERALNLDNAALINLTVEAPHFSPAYWMGWCKHYDDLCFLAFFDTGFGGNYHRASYEPSLQSLGSIGPSVRYELSRYASVHLDYGFQLWHSGFHVESNSRYNFGFIFSY
jgi:hemolysin activation/secretion protein